MEQEQNGCGRADYGARLLKSLAEELTAEFGNGFSVNSLYYFRQFHVSFPEKLPTAWEVLTWSHYKRLLSVPNAEARAWAQGARPRSLQQLAPPLAPLQDLHLAYGDLVELDHPLALRHALLYEHGVEALQV